MLRTKVNQNRLACPTSSFHRQESEQSNWVKDHVWHLVEGLSHGLSFNPFTQIHFSQLASAAYAYAGKEAVLQPDWMIAFNQDPQEQVDTLSAGDQIMVHLESAQELVEYNRVTTDLVADVYRNLKLTRRGQSRTYQEEVLYLKYLLLFETFVPPGKLIQDYPELEGDLSTIGAMSVNQNQGNLLAIFKDCGVSEEFITSQDLLRCPFLHIRASLMAADIIYYPNKTPTPRFSIDFEIVSSTLPYLDMLATDGYMAELIRQAKLTMTFQAQVFSMHRRGELVEALKML